MITMKSFKALEEWLNSLPDQTEGLASSICDTGEPYVEFYDGGLAREDDIPVVESWVATRMSDRLNRYFVNKNGRIYWRTRFESDIVNYSAIINFDENGPDEDFLTGRRCVMDHNWKIVRCYCRLYKAAHAFISQQQFKELV